MSNYTEQYQQALNDFPGSTDGVEQGLENFKQTYANLADPSTADKISQLYASSLYFNDTVTTLRTRTDLSEYMGKTSDRLNVSTVKIDQVIRDGEDVFVRWNMHFSSSAYGMGVDSESIGMTHLRFNEQGEIILHQDFWDAAAGLYEHLPIVGFFVRRAQAAMH